MLDIRHYGVYAILVLLFGRLHIAFDILPVFVFEVQVLRVSVLFCCHPRLVHASSVAASRKCSKGNRRRRIFRTTRLEEKIRGDGGHVATQ